MKPRLTTTRRVGIGNYRYPKHYVVHTQIAFQCEMTDRISFGSLGIQERV